MITDKIHSRRNFVRTSVVSFTSLLIPWLESCRMNAKYEKTIPAFLAKVVDASLIRDIGQAYVRSFPEERDSTLLEKLIIKGYPLEEKMNSDSLRIFLEQKTKDDFSDTAGETVIIKGWVLSRTEARQCALYALVQ